jgi:hypothetical protein
MLRIGERVGDVADLQRRDREQLPRQKVRHLFQHALEGRVLGRETAREGFAHGPPKTPPCSSVSPREAMAVTLAALRLGRPEMPWQPEDAPRHTHKADTPHFVGCGPK